MGAINVLKRENPDDAGKLGLALVREEDGTPKFQTLPSDQSCAWLFQGIEISSSPGLGGKLGRDRVAA